MLSVLPRSRHRSRKELSASSSFASLLWFIDPLLPYDPVAELCPKRVQIAPHVPHAVARHHQHAVRLLPRADPDLRLATHLLRLGRKVVALLVGEVSKCARHSQVSAHSTVEHDASRAENPLLLLRLRVVETGRAHIHRLLVHRERNRRVFGEKHAPRVAEVGHDEMGRRDERQNAGASARILHDSGSLPLPLHASPAPRQSRRSSASEERRIAREMGSRDS